MKERASKLSIEVYQGNEYSSCDGCGKNFSHMLKISNGQTYESRKEIDLCSDCWLEVKKWVCGQFIRSKLELKTKG